MGGHNILKSSQGLVAVRSDKIAVNETATNSGQSGLQADLIDVEFQGSFSLLAFAPKTHGAETISVMLPEQLANAPWQPGQTYHLHWAEIDSHALKPSIHQRSPIAA
jgi:putative spermidine/putrescine transport system ATP-binding protein